MSSLFAAVTKKIAAAARAGRVARTASANTRRLLDDRSGAAFVLIAFTFMLVIGMIGLAVEGGTWLLIRRNMQAAADAAAYSAVSVIAAGNAAGYVNEAGAVAAANGFPVNSTTTITVNSPPAAPDPLNLPQHGPSSASPAVEVIISQQQATTIGQLFGLNSLTIRARAVAAVNASSGTPSGTDCVLALDPSASGALTLNGGASLSLNGCGLAVNSNACGSTSSGDAVTNGTPPPPVTVTNASVSLSGCAPSANISPAPANFQNPVQDPYANVQPPTVGPCSNDPTSTPPGVNAAACGDTTKNWPAACSPTGTVNLVPGTICQGLNIQNATVILASGLYVIDGNVGGKTGGGAAPDALKMTSGNDTLEDCSASPTPSGCGPGDTGGVTIYATADSSQTYGVAGAFTVGGGGGTYNINLTAPQDTTSSQLGYVPACYGPGLIAPIPPGTPPAGEPPCGIGLWEASSLASSLAGSTGSSINGAIYTPTATLTYSGNTSGAGTGCTQIVADSITISGASSFGGSGCTANNLTTGGLVFGTPALVE